ncbi:MAG TPA: tyrosine-protein phosphatase [Thermoanaerobaculia bacterium]|nr:tyrosine-protein phosphatase [Thermoanaerobaculia bacterium]
MRARSIERMSAAALLAALIPLSGCSVIYPTPPVKNFELLNHKSMDRFDQVDDDVYRSSQPSMDQLKTLVDDHHINTIIKLNTGSEPTLPGVKLFRYRLYGPITPSAATIKDILTAIDHAEKPVLIHCSHGEDRTGLIVALYQVCKGMTPEDAYKDMVAHGFHPYRGLWNAWVRDVGWNPQHAGAARAVCPREEDLRPEEKTASR